MNAQPDSTVQQAAKSQQSTPIAVQPAQRFIELRLVLNHNRLEIL